MKAIMMIAAMALVSSVAFAHDAREEFLGKVQLRNFGESERIELTGDCPSEFNRPVEAIQFRVTRKHAEIDRLKVRFVDGREEEFGVHEGYPRDSVSRWFFLNGVRCVRSVRIVGESRGEPRWEASDVQIWGLRHHRW